MSTEFLAVEGCTLAFRNTAHTGTIKIVPYPVSQQMDAAKCQENAVWTFISFTVTGASDGAGITGGTGAGVIVGSTDKVAGKAMGVPETLPCRQEDEVDIVISGFSGGSPATFNATIYVDDPGQDKVLAV